MSATAGLSSPEQRGAVPPRPGGAPRTAAQGGSAARGGARHPSRAVAWLITRLIRRGTLLLAVALAAYAALEVASYRAAYPEGVSPAQFAMFEDNPAVRMMNGVPVGLDSAGGFTVWDAGWIWQLLLAVWAILITTRFLRGEEDVDRADLVLAGPVRPTRATAVTLGVIAGAGLVVGASISVALIVLEQRSIDSALLGLALAGVSATFAGVAAVTCQLVDVRRRAAGLAAVVLGVAWVLRMVANSTDPRAWLRWFTPLGWVEELNLYGDPAPLALLPLVLAPVALFALAIHLRGRRDIDAALLVADSAREPRLRLLGGPTAFAWRTNRAVLLAWLVGVVAYSLVIGALLSTMIEWLAGDEGYQRLLQMMGLAVAQMNQGFLAFIATVVGLVVALQVSWRVGSARAEEEAGRLEAILARSVTRWRWLGGHVGQAVLGGVGLLLAGGVAMWLGGQMAGSGELAWWDVIRATANLLPVAMLIAGLAVAAFGLIPRLTVGLPVAVAVVGYVLAMLGPALSWPQWVLNLSPFTHVALVPAEPWAATSGLVMIALGAALAVVGFVAFRGRDLSSA